MSTAAVLDENQTIPTPQEQGFGVSFVHPNKVNTIESVLETYAGQEYRTQKYVCSFESFHEKFYLSSEEDCASRKDALVLWLKQCHLALSECITDLSTLNLSKRSKEKIKYLQTLDRHGAKIISCLILIENIKMVHMITDVRSIYDMFDVPTHRPQLKTKKVKKEVSKQLYDLICWCVRTLQHIRFNSDVPAFICEAQSFEETEEEQEQQLDQVAEDLEMSIVEEPFSPTSVLNVEDGV